MNQLSTKRLSLERIAEIRLHVIDADTIDALLDHIDAIEAELAAHRAGERASTDELQMCIRSQNEGGSDGSERMEPAAGLTPERRLANLMNALADHVAGLPDEQVLADAESMGVDVSAAADKLRAFLLVKAKEAIERRDKMLDSGVKVLGRCGHCGTSLGAAIECPKCGAKCCRTEPA